MTVTVVSRPVLLFVSVLLLGAAGCASVGASPRFARHGDPAVWTGALGHQVEDAGVWVPEAVFLAALPALGANDHTLQARMSRHPSVTRGDSTRGDVTQGALAVAMAAFAGGRWASGDEGRSFEVAAESFAATTLVTSGLKLAVGRRRPYGSSTASFPSGHASFCFCAATYLARSVRDTGDDWTSSLGYLAYLPAAYVAINRVESDHHFPSDVVAGAFLGTFLTNLIYDAHYGGGDHPGIFGAGVTVTPVVAPDFAGVTVALSF